jgi:hypothetical protein
MLSFIMLNGIILTVIMLNVIILIVIVLNVIMLSVVAPRKRLPLNAPSSLINIRLE